MLARIAAVSFLFCCCCPAAVAEPILEQTLLFEVGQGGYENYRIPGLVVTAKGTLLASCEARQGNDWGVTDLVVRRGTDGGKQWSPMQKIAHIDGAIAKNPVALAKKVGQPDTVTYHNAVMIADQKTGVVHFLFCVEYMRCFYARSDDDGQTFSKPVEITSAFEAFRPAYDWKVLGTGPGHGIQLANGRLVVGVWLSTGTGGNAHRPSIISTIVSDDEGKSWQVGDVVAGETDPLVNPSENMPVELSDGRVMLNIRSESKANRRALAVSPNGATGWSKVEFVDQLAEPVCMASIYRLSGPPWSDKPRWLFSNPDNLERADGKIAPGKNRDRKNLTIKLSYDDARNWPVSKSLESSFSSYSDLSSDRAGNIYCLYERGGPPGQRPRGIVLAKFNLEWLTDGKDVGTKPGN